jgi:hypothetical protein
LLVTRLGPDSFFSYKVMLRQLLLVTTLTGVLLAQGDVYLQRGDRVLFCGASKDERRLDLTFLQTYAATRLPQSEIRLEYSDSDTFNNDRNGKAPSVLLLLPAHSSAASGKLQAGEASCLQMLTTIKAASPPTRVAAIAFDEPPGPNGDERTRLELARVETVFHC